MIETEGSKIISESLKINTTLNKLDLSGDRETNIENEMIMKKKMTTIDIKGYIIGFEGVDIVGREDLRGLGESRE